MFNEFSKYGNEFGRHSIFNKFSKYGGEFSSYSSCNEFASHPPVVVDEDGNFYGYLSVNKFNIKRIKDYDLLAWLKYKVCKQSN